MTMRRQMDFSTALFDADGRRKYLCRNERERFLAVCRRADLPTRLLCTVLAYTGCRVSEALALTPQQIDVGTQCIVLRTLKRRKQVFRAVPVPQALVHELTAMAVGLAPEERLWKWCRQTAWRHVKSVMDAAHIQGTQASPKGLRHGFGIATAEQNVPPALTQRWMGHASLETTTIYQQAVGQEERGFAKRLWRDYPNA